MSKNPARHDPALHIPGKHRDEKEVLDLLNNDDVDKLRSILRDTEVVHRLVTCKMDGSDAVIAATNERLLVCDQKFITSKAISFDYPNIAAIVYNSELVFIELTVVHAGGALYMQDIDKKHGQRMIKYLEDLIGGNYRSHGVNGRSLEYINDILYPEEIAEE